MNFNLDAWIAEQEGAPFTFTFGGEQYTCPYFLDARVLQFVKRGEDELALQLMLGADQYNRMVQTSNDKGLPVVALGKVLEQYALHNGLTLGESQASLSSSQTKAPSSRPKSRGSIKSTSAA